jgi:hypothetical protein
MERHSCKYRIVSVFIITILGLIVFFKYKPTDGMVQDYFRSECLVITERLIAQNWHGECGNKILSNSIAIEFELPYMLKVGNSVHHTYKEKEFFGGGEGIYLVGPPEKIKISLYPITELDSYEKDVLRYGSYGIKRSELVHILIDELVSASMKGEQFINGEASKQEELEAWRLAESALCCFYNHRVKIPASYSKPQYGPNNPNYRSVCYLLK